MRAKANLSLTMKFFMLLAKYRWYQVAPAGDKAVLSWAANAAGVRAMVLRQQGHMVPAPERCTGQHM